MKATQGATNVGLYGCHWDYKADLLLFSPYLYTRTACVIVMPSIFLHPWLYLPRKTDVLLCRTMAQLDFNLCPWKRLWLPLMSRFAGEMCTWVFTWLSTRIELGCTSEIKGRNHYPDLLAETKPERMPKRSFGFADELSAHHLKQTWRLASSVPRDQIFLRAFFQCALQFK